MCEKPSNGVNGEYLCMCISYVVAFSNFLNCLLPQAMRAYRTLCTESLFDSVQAKEIAVPKQMKNVIGTSLILWLLKRTI